MDNNNVAIAALALTATIATGFFAMSIRFFALLNKQNTTHEKLSDTMDKVASSSKEVANATVKSAKEAEQRNGHLGELVAQGNQLTGEMLEEQKKTAALLAKNPTSQNVKEQHVEHQHVSSQEENK